MPGPPPPPPAPAAPPPPTFAPPKANKSSGGGDGRNMLLESIRLGKNLKKTHTVDKSAPILGGKTSAVTTPVGNGVGVRGQSGQSAAPVQNGGMPPLAGLFAGGMPKLRPTRRDTGASPNIAQSDNNNSKTLPRNTRLSPEKAKPMPLSPNPVRHGAQTNVSQLGQALSQVLGGGVAAPKRPVEPRGRAPPPQPPTPTNKPNLTLSTSDSRLTNSSTLHRMSSSNTPETPTTPQNICKTPTGPNPNPSSLHRNRSSGQQSSVTAWALDAFNQVNYTGSMSNLQPASLPPSSLHASSSDVTEHSARTLNHGKPNLAPRPPSINGQSADGKPQISPKKLASNGRPASRAQSMRVPRSPPVTPPPPGFPGAPGSNGFNTMKPCALVGKHFAPQPPTGPRPVRPLRPPTHGPPPPPARPPNLPPPPPPPHRPPTPVTAMPPMNIGAGGPPQPPVRGSSMRASELDLRFVDCFHPMPQFPFPDAFLRIDKSYSSVNAAINTINERSRKAGSKHDSRNK